MQAELDHLWPIQKESIRRLFAYLRHTQSHNQRARVILQLPTGAGKTVLAAAIIALGRDKDRRILFTVPALELINQTIERLIQNGVNPQDIGVIQRQHPMTDSAKPIQIASLQTLLNRDLVAMDFDLVIIDEAHTIFSTLLTKMMSAWRCPFIGFTATPYTKGLGKYYDKLIQPSSLEKLIADKRLSSFRVFSGNKAPDLKGVTVRQGDYAIGELAKRSNKQDLIADIVSTWLRLAQGRSTLCFCVDRAHAKAVQEDFLAHGVTAGYTDCYTPIEEREGIRKDFESGKCSVVCNVGVLTTGVDWDVRCIILARSTKSEILYTQIIGRGLRTATGKDDCLILDHSGTTAQLGFVTDIHHKTLDNGKRVASAPPVDKELPMPKECPSCHHMKKANMHECPHCGFAPKKRSTVVIHAGELVELRARMAKKKLNTDMSVEQKRLFYGELKWIASDRGYNEKWASHKYRERFDVWPNAYRNAEKVEPSTQTKNWVKSGIIRWAKRKTAISGE